MNGNKARIITPSTPNIIPNGSKKSIKYSKIDKLFIFKLTTHQITKPAIADTFTALPKTNIALVFILVKIVLIILGFLYGGNSKVKLEGTPFKIVLDKTKLTKKVKITPKRIKHVNKSALKTLLAYI